MSKSLKNLATAMALTGAAVTAPAFGQATVTVNGLLDNFVGSMQNSGDTSRTLGLFSNGMTTSWWGVKGSEDLGGGNKALFQLDGFINTATGAQGRFPGDPLFSRDAWVGLSGSYGSIELGRNLAPNFLPMIIFNPFGDSFSFSPLVLHSFISTSVWTNSIAGDTGWDNEIIYSTPNWSGFSANFFYQLSGVAGDSGANNTGVNALYFHGPLALSMYYEKIEVNNPFSSVGGVQAVTGPLGTEVANRQDAWFVGGSYDFMVAKLYLTFQETDHDVDLNDKTYSLGLGVPVSPVGTINFGWADTKRIANDIGLNETRNTETLGYDHHLSKRTDVYVNVMHDKVSDFSGETSVGVGIRHTF